MTGKLLAALGLVTLVALAGTTIAGLMVIKDRIRVVVAADDAGERPDPTALLRDDLQTVANDVGALTQAVGDNFGRLAAGIDAGAERRHAEVVAMRGEIQQLRQQLEAQRARGEALATMLQAVQERLAAVAMVGAAPSTPTEARPVTVATTPVAESPPVATVPDVPPPVTPAADPAPTPPAAAAGNPPGFLGFQVGGRKFRFDELQRYVLIPELSRVGFDAKSTLHDFSGVTSQLSGEFAADFDDPKGAWTGSVRCAAATLVTGVEGRDTAMREHLDTEHHADIAFAVERFEPAADGIDVGKQTVRGDVIGTMTIRGKAQPLRMPVVVTVDASKRVVVEGQTPLKLGDYGVPVPSQLGLISMQDEVKVWVALRARVQKEGK